MNEKKNELLELLVPKRITVRQLAELIPPHKDCYISGDGNSDYFIGQMKDIPECIMECLVHEIVPQIFPASEKSNKIFDWGMGIFIDPVLLLDLLVKTFPEINKYSDLIDEYYSRATENEENFLEILEIHKRHREKKAKGNRYDDSLFTDDLNEQIKELKNDDFNTEKAVAEFLEMDILPETDSEIDSEVIEDDIPDNFVKQLKETADNLVDKGKLILEG